MLLDCIPSQLSSYDAVVLGGGAFGLSLALRVIDENKPFRLLIIEKRNVYQRDRTWCFWDDPDIPKVIRNMAQQHYHTSILSHHSQQYELRHAKTPYLMLDSADFYTAAQHHISQSSQIDMCMGQCVTEPLNHPNIIDARAQWVKDEYPYAVYQRFLGVVIETQQAHGFLPGKARIMSELRIEDNQVWFNYILPINAHRCLFEVTTFGQKILSEAQLRQVLITQLQLVLPNKQYQIEHTEIGHLPMHEVKQEHSQPLRYGGASGMLRPATGYAFLQIQRQVDELLAVWEERHTVKTAQFSVMTRVMDRIFLRVIKDQPQWLPSTFMAMAQRLTPSDFIAFMNNNLSLSLWCKVVMAVPKYPFIKAACRGLL